jgi:hypothetical protein
MSEPSAQFPAFTNHRLYPADEVDAHIRNLSAEIARLKAALDDAVARAEEAERRTGGLNDAEERVGRAFVVAQEAADTTLREAERSAASVVSEARRRAELLLTKAREDALGVVEGARATVADLYASVAGQTTQGTEPNVISLDEQPVVPAHVEVAPFAPPAAGPPSNGAQRSAPTDARENGSQTTEPERPTERVGDRRPDVDEDRFTGDPSVVLPPRRARRFRDR